MFKAIYHLFLGKPINFYSPYTIDETYQQLEEASARRKQKPSMGRWIWDVLTRQDRHFFPIMLEVIDEQSYQFSTQRDETAGIRISMQGKVQKDETGVKVTGRVRVNIFTLLMIQLWLLVLLVVSGLMIYMLMFETPFFVVPLVFTLVLFIYVMSVKQDQNKMYNKIEALIGKSKQKNSVQASILA